MENKATSSASENILSKDLDNLFENFLKPGKLIKEKEITKGLIVKLSPLDVGESMQAEASVVSTNSGVPFDVVGKVRGASILSRAIISMNENVIVSDEMSETDIRVRRSALYKNLLKLPPIVLQKIFDFYLETVKEQEGLYSSGAELAKNIENF